MLIRAYQDDDAGPTRAVYERAAHGSASTHYTTQQLDAWAPEANAATLTRWAARRAAAQTIVAAEQERVVGFSGLVGGTLLDMLFVDPDFGRRGVGANLVSAVVNLARDSGAPYIETHASLTARPVFERSGFVVVAEETPVIRGVALANFRMHVHFDS